ncbi:MAG: hypothetical protein ACYDH1_12170 [Anaerolineaceae bacterium]
MKTKKSGCLRSLLISLTGLVLICLAAVGLVARDNARLPNQSEFTDKLSQTEKSRIIEAQHLRQTFGDEILPGWGQAEIPVILYNEEFAYLTGISTPPPDGWRTVRSGEQRGTTWEVVPGDDLQGMPFYRQALLPGITPQAFTVKIGTSYAATLTTYEYFPISMHSQLQENLPEFIKPIFPYRVYIDLLVSGSDQFETLILHEAAHAYQGIMAPDRLVAGEQANLDLENVYPWNDSSLREDWQAELDLLALALRAKTDEETSSLTQEFLQIRLARRQSAGLSTEMIDFERHREWVEGIGRYAEISVYRLANERTEYSPARETIHIPDFDRYKKYDQRWAREIDQMKRLASDGSERRFYYTGMAQAVLLDRLYPDWKNQLFEPGIWLEDLLAQAVLTANDLKQ